MDRPRRHGRHDITTSRKSFDSLFPVSLRLILKITRYFSTLADFVVWF